MDLEDRKKYKNQESNDKYSKHKSITKSGRMTKTPNKLMTTSSDEAPARKRPCKTSLSVKKELARLQDIAIAIKNKHVTKKSTSKTMIQGNRSKVAYTDVTMTPDDSSTFLPSINLSEMAGQTEMEIAIPPVHYNFNPNAEAVALPSESHIGKTTIKKLPPANETASSVSHVSAKTYLKSKVISNEVITLEKRNSDFPEKSHHTITNPEHTTDDLQQILNDSQSTLEVSNLVVTPVNNSTFLLPPISASEMARQTEIVILPACDFDLNAEAIALPNESHVGKAIQKKSPPANITATSVTHHLSQKTYLKSTFGNETSISKNRDCNFPKKRDYSRILNDNCMTDNNLQKIFETLQSIEKQNKEIMESQTEMKLQIVHIQEYLAEKNLGEAQLTETLYQPLMGFPLSTIEQFKEIETVEQKNTRKKLYQHILKLGGTKPRDFLHCALKEIMTDRLVCNFSWRGDKKSETFGNTKVSNILFQAAKSCPLFNGPETKTEYKKEIQEILRCIKQRYRNQMKKLVVPETEDSDDDGEYDAIMKEINRLQQFDEEADSGDADFEQEDLLDESFDESED